MEEITKKFNAIKINDNIKIDAEKQAVIQTKLDAMETK